jgi:hypothetical protein
MVRHCREVSRREIEPVTIAILDYLTKAPFYDPQAEPYLGANIFGN